MLVDTSDEATGTYSAHVMQIEMAAGASDGASTTSTTTANISASEAGTPTSETSASADGAVNATGALTDSAVDTDTTGDDVYILVQTYFPSQSGGFTLVQTGYDLFGVTDDDVNLLGNILDFLAFTSDEVQAAETTSATDVAPTDQTSDASELVDSIASAMPSFSDIFTPPANKCAVNTGDGSIRQYSKCSTALK